MVCKLETVVLSLTAIAVAASTLEEFELEAKVAPASSKLKVMSLKLTLYVLLVKASKFSIEILPVTCIF